MLWLILPKDSRYGSRRFVLSNLTDYAVANSHSILGSIRLGNYQCLESLVQIFTNYIEPDDVVIVTDDIPMDDRKQLRDQFPSISIIVASSDYQIGSLVPFGVEHCIIPEGHQGLRAMFADIDAYENPH